MKIFMNVARMYRYDTIPIFQENIKSLIYAEYSKKKCMLAPHLTLHSEIGTSSPTHWNEHHDRHSTKMDPELLEMTLTTLACVQAYKALKKKKRRRKRIWIKARVSLKKIDGSIEE